MRKPLDSPMFGETEWASEEETALLEKLARECPVSVFRALTQVCNARGYTIFIDVLAPTS